MHDKQVYRCGCKQVKKIDGAKAQDYQKGQDNSEFLERINEANQSITFIAVTDKCASIVFSN